MSKKKYSRHYNLKRKCVVCGTRITNRAARCRKHFALSRKLPGKRYYHENKRCYCGRVVMDTSPMCNICTNKLRRGDYHPYWKGENVTYSPLHRWVRKNKKKITYCQVCGKRGMKLEVANLSGLYKRILDDYVWSCHSCNLRMRKFVVNINRRSSLEKAKR